MQGRKREERDFLKTWILNYFLGRPLALSPAKVKNECCWEEVAHGVKMLPN